MREDNFDPCHENKYEVNCTETTTKRILKTADPAAVGHHLLEEV